MQEGLLLLDPAREFVLSEGRAGAGPVVYWMQREMRAVDNWGLVHARARARDLGRTLLVVFVLAPAFAGAGERQYRFMLRGLARTAVELEKRGFPLVLLEGDPPEVLAALVRRLDAACVCTDFNPLRLTRDWQARLGDKIACPLVEIDGHNIVPCRFVSAKQEYGAYTLRPKLHRLVPRFLTEFCDYGEQSPGLVRAACARAGRAAGTLLEGGEEAITKTLLAKLPRGLMRDAYDVGEAWPAGTDAGLTRMNEFFGADLAGYAAGHNDPVAERSSHLSVYMHYGQLAPQRVALELARVSSGGGESAEAFFEQLVVRRELADNFCLYNDKYDSVDGFPAWVREDIPLHRRDPRLRLFTEKELEEGRTDDPLWNAAQQRLVARGWMHGYMRMYWAKRILEWTPTVEEALRVALAINDRWQLDGRDTNGYAGIAWSLGGVHDRPWQRREIFGRVRYMNANGCRRKFDVEAYIEGSPPAPLRKF